MTTQQQTERDEALIAEKKRLADELERMYNGAWADDAVTLRHAAALLRGDEPAKPDRYVEIAREFLAAWGERVLAVDQGEYDGDKRFQAAAAVLRRHFEPSAEVKAMLETFSADVVDAQSRYVIVHQLRASADIQDRETKRKTGWADTNDRACLMRSAADAIEALADFILKGDQ